MPELYKGLTLNSFLDNAPPPNRPGQREKVNLKAIMDAILTDSQNPDNITLPQGKISIVSQDGLTKKLLFRFDNVPLGVRQVIIPSILPSGSSLGYAGGHFIMHVDAVSASYNLHYSLEVYNIFTMGCGPAWQMQVAPYYDIDPWRLYDPGSGEHAQIGIDCISGSRNGGETPGSIALISRYDIYTDLCFWGEIAFTSVEYLI